MSHLSNCCPLMPGFVMSGVENLSAMSWKDAAVSSTYFSWLGVIHVLSLACVIRMPKTYLATPRSVMGHLAIIFFWIVAQ